MRSDSDGLAVDATTVYLAERTGIYACARSGCGGVATKLATEASGAVAIAVDASGLYWVNGTGDVTWLAK